VRRADPPCKESGVLPTEYRINKLKRRPRPNKRAVGPLQIKKGRGCEPDKTYIVRRPVAVSVPNALTEVCHAFAQGNA
jgi:hypothetical protein